MVSCAVVKCVSRTSKDRADNKKGVRFFSIPTVIRHQCALTRSRSERRRAVWLARINRKDLRDADVKVYTKVCSLHFISGSPSALYHENHPDWAPSLNLGYSVSCPSGVSKFARYDRLKQRRIKKTSLITSGIDFSCVGKSQDSIITKELPEEQEHAADVVEDPALAEQLPHIPHHSSFGGIHSKDDFKEDAYDMEGIQIKTDDDFEENEEDKVSSERVCVIVGKDEYHSIYMKYTALSKEYADLCKLSRRWRDQVTKLEADKLELLDLLRLAEEKVQKLSKNISAREENIRENGYKDTGNAVI